MYFSSVLDCWVSYNLSHIIIIKLYKYNIKWYLLWHIYTTIQKFGVCKMFLYVFKRILMCSPRLLLLDKKYSKNGNIVKYYYNFYSILIYFEMSCIPVS